jgi:hypothetical protein
MRLFIGVDRSTGTNQTLTPNPDAIYLMAFFNTKDVGPVVIDVPPADGGSLNANIDNVWQAPLEDAGLVGTDKGKGGKYLILPPGYAETAPNGYIPLQSDTYGGFALMRSSLKSHSDADIAASVAYGKRIKIYPLSKAANPPETTFTDAQDALFDSTIRYDMSFFEGLNRIIQTEPWLDRDRAMIDPLKTLGIEKGKPFNPSAETKAALDEGIHEAQAWLEAKYDAGLSRHIGEEAGGLIPLPPTSSRRRRQASPIPTTIPSTIAAWHIPTPSSASSGLARASSI